MCMVGSQTRADVKRPSNLGDIQPESLKQACCNRTSAAGSWLQRMLHEICPSERQAEASHSGHMAGSLQPHL